MQYRDCTKVSEKWRGFSLVELLVVLLLMGLVASLAFPRIQTSLLAFERNAMQDKLFLFLRQQMSQAAVDGIAFSIPGGTSFSLTENEASNLIEFEAIDQRSSNSPSLFYTAIESVQINSRGICHSTRLSINYYEASRELVLGQPFCKQSPTSAVASDD